MVRKIVIQLSPYALADADTFRVVHYLHGNEIFLKPSLFFFATYYNKPVRAKVDTHGKNFRGGGRVLYTRIIESHDMNAVVKDFIESKYRAKDVFEKKLSGLKGAVLRSSKHHVAFNQAVIAFHTGKYKVAGNIFKRLLTESCLNTLDLAETVLALTEIYAFTGQFMRVLDLTPKMLTALQSCSDKSSNEEYVQDLVSRLQIANLRAHVLLRNFENCRFDDNVLYLSRRPAFTKWLCMFLKAQFEYHSGRYKSASGLIMQAEYEYCQSELTNDKFDEHDQSRNAIVDSIENSRNLNVFFLKYGYCRACLRFNALGCIFTHLSKPNLSLLYFQKALNKYQTAADSERKRSAEDVMKKAAGDGKCDNTSKSATPQCVPFFCRSQLARLSILQNIGLTYLSLGQPAQAFDYLVKVVSYINNNSRLWLRLAECCILTHKNENNIDPIEENGQQAKSFIIKGVIGVGPHRKVVLSTNSNNKLKISSYHSAVPTLSLEFAYFCLKNALNVLPEVDETDVDNVVSATSSRYTFPASFGPPTSAKEVLRVKCSILCAASYVCLYLGEYQATLQCSKNLLNLKMTITREQELLARLYAAEALVLLGRASEATAFLKVDAQTQQRLFKNDESSDGTAENSFPCSSYKLVLNFNAAVACVFNKEYEKAWQIMTTINGNVKELPLPCALFNLYIQLQKGMSK
uniref:CCR4-NOT transcription complex subunit 10 n=1 Tax=Romanomermis culicivorax TaxID=13658 RepID=A0A915LAA3_ROMCU